MLKSKLSLQRGVGTGSTWSASTVRVSSAWSLLVSAFKFYVQDSGLGTSWLIFNSLDKTWAKSRKRVINQGAQAEQQGFTWSLMNSCQWLQLLHQSLSLSKAAFMIWGHWTEVTDQWLMICSFPSSIPVAASAAAESLSNISLSKLWWLEDTSSLRKASTPNFKSCEMRRYMSTDISIIYLHKTPSICFSLHNTFAQFQAELAMSFLFFFVGSLSSLFAPF